MNKIITLSAITLFISGGAFAQWCIPTETPTTLNSYASSSPVITNVTFNTINRTTAASDKELYVNTGLGTTVAQGSSFFFSMTYTIDTPICPEMHLRIWIDWNLDGDFSDAGELALTMNNSTVNSFSGFIGIPATAVIGTTRMRVASKMVEACGHTAPDPCVPDESFGWHGEIEDYDITVTPQVGIEEIALATNIDLFVNSAGVQLSYYLNIGADVQLDIYDVNGRRIHTFLNEGQAVGEQKILISNSEFTNTGIYFAALTINEQMYTRKFAVAK